MKHAFFLFVITLHFEVVGFAKKENTGGEKKYFLRPSSINHWNGGGGGAVS